MQHYEIVTLPARKVRGFSTRTSNESPDMQTKIGALWSSFMQPDIQNVLAPEAGTPFYGIYTNYEVDGSYDVVTACTSAATDPRFTEVTIPAGEYLRLPIENGSPEAIGKAWREVWCDQYLPRAYTVDFEEYLSPNEVVLYIALADICQSCGMPMRQDADYGTERDGTKSSEYCTYCYQNGAFTKNCTIEEMVDFCLENTPLACMPADLATARTQMLAYFPTLKRWNCTK